MSPTVAIWFSFITLISDSNRRKPARIVADAWRYDGAVLLLHGDVGAFGKHRVEMRRHHELRPAAAGPLAQRDHIALAVDRSVLEAEFLHPLLIIFGADLFLERRRRNFRDALLFGEGPLVVGLDVVERLDDLGMGEDGLEVGRGSCLRANLVHQRVLRDGDKGDCQDRSSECHQ